MLTAKSLLQTLRMTAPKHQVEFHW